MGKLELLFLVSILTVAIFATETNEKNSPFLSKAEETWASSSKLGQHSVKNEKRDNSKKLPREKRQAAVANTVGMIGDLAAGVIRQGGGGILQLVKYINQKRKDGFANAIVIIKNYSKWTLYNPESAINYNDATLQLPGVSIYPDQYQAFATMQTKYGDGLEALISWSYKDKVKKETRKCVVYWKVYHRNRDAVYFIYTDYVTTPAPVHNTLVLGCMPLEESDLQYKIAMAMASDSHSYHPFVSKEYGPGEVLQSCDENICLQGVMNSGHQTNITLSFYPRDIDNAAGSITEEDLELQLDKQDWCKSKWCRQETLYKSAAVELWGSVSTCVAIASLIMLCY